MFAVQQKQMASMAEALQKAFFLERTRNKAAATSPAPVSSSLFQSVSSCTVSSLDPFSSHLHVPVLLRGFNRSVSTPAMIDSAATALFINEKFVRSNKIPKRALPHQIAVNNIDGTRNRAGHITHYARLKVKIGDIEETTEFLITDLGPENVILGLPWLKRTTQRSTG